MEPSMQVWAVFYHPTLFTEDVGLSSVEFLRIHVNVNLCIQLYQRALKIIDAFDPEAGARIRRFYRREDACRKIYIYSFKQFLAKPALQLGTLIGHFLRRLMLLEKGVDPGAMKFSATEAGKPYIVREWESGPLDASLN